MYGIYATGHRKTTIKTLLKYAEICIQLGRLNFFSAQLHCTLAKQQGYVVLDGTMAAWGMGYGPRGTEVNMNSP